MNEINACITLRKCINKITHVFGNADSNSILEVYEGYEWEHCDRAFRERRALREYFQEEICFFYKHLPIVWMHPSALLAAQIVESCALQQKYLQAHDLIPECQELLEYGIGEIISLLEKIILFRYHN